MDAIEALKTRRTIRRYKPTPVPRKILEQAVDCARLAPSAANLQPLEYIIVDDEDLARTLYSHVKMGSYLKGDEAIGENPDERPGAYIAVLYRDTGVKWSERDLGSSTHALLLALHARGFGSCWMANIQRAPIRELLAVPEELELDALVAVGEARETSEPIDLVEDTLYFYEAPGALRVPKRKLEDLAFANRYGESL